MGSRCSALVCTANAHEVHLITSKLELRVEVEKIEPLNTLIGAGRRLQCWIALRDQHGGGIPAISLKTLIGTIGKG